MDAQTGIHAVDRDSILELIEVWMYYGMLAMLLFLLLFETDFNSSVLKSNKL